MWQIPLKLLHLSHQMFCSEVIHGHKHSNFPLSSLITFSSKNLFDPLRVQSFVIYCEFFGKNIKLLKDPLSFSEDLFSSKFFLLKSVFMDLQRRVIYLLKVQGSIRHRRLQLIRLVIENNNVLFGYFFLSHCVLNIISYHIRKWCCFIKDYTIFAS